MTLWFEGVDDEPTGPTCSHIRSLSLRRVTGARAGRYSEAFRTPPDAAKPMTWWHWMNGNITKEGITADLEAMKRIRLGVFQIFNVSQGEPLGPVKFMSPEWRALTKHAISEANRLGLKLAIHNCAGWSESGGPWVTPDQSMQKLVWTETSVHGGSRFGGTLAQPETIRGTYRDIAALAFPTLPGDASNATAMASDVTTSVAGLGAPGLLRGDPASAVNLPLPAGRPQFVQVAFREPATFASVRIACRGRDVPAAGPVAVSDDGRSWRTIAPLPAFPGRGGATATASFPVTTARLYRITMTRADRAARRLALTAIGFGSMRMNQMAAKIGMVRNARLTFTKGEWPAAMTIRRDKIDDLTARMQAGGRLDWDAPAGDWTIIRFGRTSTGRRTRPPGQRTWPGVRQDEPRGGGGALRRHDGEGDRRRGSARGAEPEIRARRQLGGRHAELDSGLPRRVPEADGLRSDSLAPGVHRACGRQPGRKRAGTLGLPPRNGRTDHRKPLRPDPRSLREARMEFAAEAPGIGMPTIADEVQCKGRTDMPMGEFWLDGHNDSKEAATSAHIYGKRRAWPTSRRSPATQSRRKRPTTTRRSATSTSAGASTCSSSTATRCSPGWTNSPA